MTEVLHLAARVGGRWRPGIGDPSVMGWVTVAGYLIAAVLCWRCATRLTRQGLRASDDRARRTWYLLAAVLLLLGINKQLDLQSWVTLLGKGLAKSGRWPKATIQWWFAAVMLTVSVVSTGVLFWLARGALRRLAPALVGASFLVCFVLIRALSFHPMDRLLAARLAGLKVNWVLELGGIVCVGFGAWLDLRRSARSVGTIDVDR